MCQSNIVLKFCEKHNCAYTQRGNANRMHCRQCTNERANEHRKVNPLNENAREKKREIDRIYQSKKRLENPVYYKLIQERHKQTEKFRDRIIEKTLIKSSNIYCIKCNYKRTYSNEYCSECLDVLYIIKNHDFISICKHCNKEYGLDVKISNHGKVFQLNKYCSVECNDDNKKQNYIAYRKEYKKTEVFKNTQRERKRNDTYRKRVIKSGNEYQYIKRHTLFQRFNYICQGCNVKCVYPNDVNYNQDNCATIDHIKPVSKGGSHTYDNTQLLCRKCNWMKRDNEKYFEHKQMSLQMQLQFDLNNTKHDTGQQLRLFECSHST